MCMCVLFLLKQKEQVRYMENCSSTGKFRPGAIDLRGFAASNSRSKFYNLHCFTCRTTN